jgi:hypothetical protein
MGCVVVEGDVGQVSVERKGTWETFSWAAANLWSYHSIILSKIARRNLQYDSSAVWIETGRGGIEEEQTKDYYKIQAAYIPPRLYKVSSSPPYSPTLQVGLRTVRITGTAVGFTARYATWFTQPSVFHSYQILNGTVRV